MSNQLVTEPISQIENVNPDVQLYAEEERALKSAPALRQRSRELRAKSEILREKNAETMKQADQVVERYYHLNFGAL